MDLRSNHPEQLRWLAQSFNDVSAVHGFGFEYSISEGCRGSWNSSFGSNPDHIMYVPSTYNCRALSSALTGPRPPIEPGDHEKRYLLPDSQWYDSVRLQVVIKGNSQIFQKVARPPPAARPAPAAKPPATNPVPQQRSPIHPKQLFNATKQKQQQPTDDFSFDDSLFNNLELNAEVCH